MTKEQALHHMDTAVRQDRERFFRLADPLVLQPKYQHHLDELESVKQQWRDLTKQPDYPNVDFPPPLPDWFPAWQFMTLRKDETLVEFMRDMNT